MTIPPVSEREVRPCLDLGGPNDCNFIKLLNCSKECFPDGNYRCHRPCSRHFTVSELWELIEEHNDLQTAPEEGFYKERVVVVTAGMHCPCVDSDYVWTPEDPVLKCSHRDNSDPDSSCSLDGRSIPPHCPLPIATRDQFNQAFPNSSFVEINKPVNTLYKEANND